jgi:Protein of unknown function (DUF2695)
VWVTGGVPATHLRKMMLEERQLRNYAQNTIRHYLRKVERTDLDDIFAVLQSKGGFCDCEVLYNVAETSRLKAKYWRSQVAGETEKTPHTPHSRPN